MPAEPKPVPEFSFLVDITSVPPSGRVYRLAASADECAAVAARLGVEKIDALTAALEVKAGAGGVTKVTGTVDAALTQTCVVSLVPVPATISEAVEAGFIPEEIALKKKKAKEDAEEELDLGDEDPPEVVRDGRIDLGELAIEQVALALDPYPRAPGAAFDPAAWSSPDQNGENTAPSGPFAALAGLGKGNGKPPKR